jgi:hypothetical protein
MMMELIAVNRLHAPPLKYAYIFSDDFILAFKGGKWYYLHCFSKLAHLIDF